MSHGQLRHGPRVDAGTGGREHHHGRADLRRHLHRRLRAGGGHVRGARPAAGRHRPRHRHSRRRGQRRLPRPVLRARRGVRLPAAPGQVDQHLGAQVRAGSARRRLGRSGATPRNCPTTWCSTSTTSAATCPSSRSTSPARPGRSSPSTTTSSGSAMRGTRRIHDASYEIGQYLAAEIVKLGPFELLCDSNPETGIPTVTWRIREARTPATPSSTWPTGCATEGWQVPAYTLTGTASDIPVQRILVRLGVSRDMAVLAPGRLPERGGPLHQASGHCAHVKGGIGRVQPPVSGGFSHRRAASRSAVRRSAVRADRRGPAPREPRQCRLPARQRGMPRPHAGALGTERQPKCSPRCSAKLLPPVDAAPCYAAPVR